MTRYAWIENGQVTNVILWDGESGLAVPDHVSLIDSPSVGIGWTHDGDGFHPPVNDAGHD